MTTCISTASIPAPERPGFWNDVSSRYFVKLDCQLDGLLGGPNAGGFQASLRHSSFGNLDLIDLQASAHSVERVGKHASEHDYFILSLVTHGACELIQDQRHCLLGAGDLALYDTSRPYKVVLPQSVRLCSLRIPQEMLRICNPAIEHAVSKPLAATDAIGRIVGGFMRSLFDEQEGVAGFRKDALARPLIEMLSIGLQSLVEGEVEACSRLSQFHIDRIKRLVQANLADPELSVDWIAAKLRMSVSSVHRVFARQPVSVSEYIWAKRLEACEMALANPCLRERSISDIAYAWGFSSNAHFSRAFKRHTGFTPREYRAKSLHR